MLHNRFYLCINNYHVLILDSINKREIDIRKGRVEVLSDLVLIEVNSERSVDTSSSRFQHLR